MVTPASERRGDASMKVQGRCHCREVQYEAEVEPGTISVCHCLDCQTMTGSAFRANIRSLPERSAS
jgi:hypothetical protein